MKQLFGRIGTAFRILIGREPTWWGIQAEWAEIQMGAADLFQKHNALAARLAKRIKELEALEDEKDCGCDEQLSLDQLPLKARKAELRARAFGHMRPRGLLAGNGAHRGHTSEGDIPPEGRWVPAEEETTE